MAPNAVVADRNPTRHPHLSRPVHMTGSSSPPQASASEYDLRQASADRWQLMEPLPTERAALEAELRRLDAKLSSLEDESDAEFQLGCEVLSQRQLAQQQQAHVRFDRTNSSLSMLFAHECDQVNARYAERCQQLKHDMSEELQREIRRLKYTRDGVSVMDRRRLVRRSGGGGSNSTLASTSSQFSMGNASSGQAGGEDASSQDPYYSGVSTTAAQLAEKKRMDVLLSATPIFQRLNKTLGDDLVSKDLEMIKETMPSLLMDGDGDASAVEDEEEQEEREMELVRKQLRSGGGSGVSVKRRRLAYDPQQIPEGQVVVVYRTTGSNSSRKKPQKGKKHQQREEDDDAWPEVAAGVVTTKTSTQVFLLTDEGSFETVELSDWKSGRVSIHTT